MKLLQKVMEKRSSGRKRNPDYELDLALGEA